MRSETPKAGGPRSPLKQESKLRQLVTTTGFRVVLVAACIGIWAIVSSTELIDPFYISSPAKVADRLWEFVSTGMIFNHIWVTLREAVQGFVAGLIVGVLTGFALGQSRVLSTVCMPLLNMANTLPRVALAPLFVLWFGIGESSKVILVFTIVVVILTFNTYAGTQTVDRDLLTSTRLLGANRLQVLRTVTLPFSLPWILAGAQIALAWSIGGAVIGEYIVSRAGLGYLLSSYQNVIDQTGLLAVCVVLLIVSGGLFAILSLVERRLLRWRPER